MLYWHVSWGVKPNTTLLIINPNSTNRATMGGLHPLGVSTGPEWKLSCFVLRKKIAKNQNNLAYHPGPVQPPFGECSHLLI